MAIDSPRLLQVIELPRLIYLLSPIVMVFSEGDDVMYLAGRWRAESTVILVRFPAPAHDFVN